MMVTIDSFIFALSPAAAVLASAILRYDSVIAASNCGACSGVIFKVFCHFSSDFLAISSGDWPVFFPESPAYAVGARRGEAMRSRTNETQPNRTNLITHLRGNVSPHARGRTSGWTGGV